MIFEQLIRKRVFIKFKNDSYSSDKNAILLEITNFGIWIKSENNIRFYPYNNIEYISTDNLQNYAK